MGRQIPVTRDSLEKGAFFLKFLVSMLPLRSESGLKLRIWPLQHLLAITGLIKDVEWFVGPLCLEKGAIF